MKMGDPEVAEAILSEDDKGFKLEIEIAVERKARLGGKHLPEHSLGTRHAHFHLRSF